MICLGRGVFVVLILLCALTSVGALCCMKRFRGGYVLEEADRKGVRENEGGRRRGRGALAAGVSGAGGQGGELPAAGK